MRYRPWCGRTTARQRKGNRTLNSAATRATSNVDTLAYGGSLELGWKNPSGANYVRIRGGQVDNNLKNTTSANVTAELIPVYYPLYIHFPYVRPLGLPISTRFDPDSCFNIRR